jgi:hypothetical protein
MSDEIIPLSFQKPIYKNSHILLATLLGGPLGATWLLAENFKKLGHQEKIRKTWIWGIVASILVILISFLLPDDWNIPNFVFPLICIVIASQVTKMTQGADIRQHLSEGGAVFSAWRAFCIGLVCLLLMVATIAIILVLTGHPFSEDPY